MLAPIHFHDEEIMLDPGGGMAAWFAITILMWAVPLLLAVWFIRTLNAMLAAQRDIVEQLRVIAQQRPNKE